jgi:flagellar basal-body rod protein FlgF
MDRLIYTAMTGCQPDTEPSGGSGAQSGQRVDQWLSRRGASTACGASAIERGQKGLPTRAFAGCQHAYRFHARGRKFIPAAPSTWRCRGRAGLRYKPDGSEAYTRSGNFEVNVNGVLQTRSGLPVQGDGGPISIPPEVKVSVGIDGTMSTVPESGAQNIVNSGGARQAGQSAGS